MAFFGKAEANFTATELLTAANARIAALEAEVATLKSASSDFEAKITVLTGEVSTAQAAVTAKDTELKNVQAQLAAAQTRANDVIAGQGLAADQLPAAAPNEHATAPKETAWQTYQRLANSNPREAGAFWNAHADEILRTRAV
jgi:chromosome segregation ATPase